MFKRIFKHSFPVINTLGYCFQINKFFCFFWLRAIQLLKCDVHQNANVCQQLGEGMVMSMEMFTHKKISQFST